MNIKLIISAVLLTSALGLGSAYAQDNVASPGAQAGGAAGNGSSGGAVNSRARTEPQEGRSDSSAKDLGAAAGTNAPATANGLQRDKLDK